MSGQPFLLLYGKWPFCTSQPCLWLLSLPWRILCVPLPEPHVTVASGWPHPCSLHSSIVRSDLFLVDLVARQRPLMFSGSLFDPDVLEPFFPIPPVIVWLTILPIHKMFRIAEWLLVHVLPEVFPEMQLPPLQLLLMTALLELCSCHWD